MVSIKILSIFITDNNICFLSTKSVSGSCYTGENGWRNGWWKFNCHNWNKLHLKIYKNRTVILNCNNISNCFNCYFSSTVYIVSLSKTLKKSKLLTNNVPNACIRSNWILLEKCCQNILEDTSYSEREWSFFRPPTIWLVKCSIKLKLLPSNVCPHVCTFLHACKTRDCEQINAAAWWIRACD